MAGMVGWYTQLSTTDSSVDEHIQINISDIGYSSFMD